MSDDAENRAPIDFGECAELRFELFATPEDAEAALALERQLNRWGATEPEPPEIDGDGYARRS